MNKENGTNVPTGRDNTYDKTEVRRKTLEELYETSFSDDQRRVLDSMFSEGGGGHDGEEDVPEEVLLYHGGYAESSSSINPAASPFVIALDITNCTITKLRGYISTAGTISLCAYPASDLGNNIAWDTTKIIDLVTFTCSEVGDMTIEFDEPIVVPEDYHLGFQRNTDTGRIGTNTTSEVSGGVAAYYFSASGSYAGKIRATDKAISADIYGYSNEAQPVETVIESTLKGKKVSIIGDSISTFTGWIPSGNRTYYTGNNSGVSSVEDTWWKKVINALGLTLLVNNSYSGRAVSSIRDTDQYHTDDAGYRESTVIKCQNGSILPDIIIIKLGINDFNRECPLGEWDGTSAVPTDPSTFSNAYAMMLNHVMTHYPRARVYCCTLMASEWMNGGVGFPEINDNGDNAERWNEVIRRIAGVFGAEILDHARCGITYFNLPIYAGDYDTTARTGIHPNAAGHSLIANQTIRDMDNAVRIRY